MGTVYNSYPPKVMAQGLQRESPKEVTFRGKGSGTWTQPPFSILCPEFSTENSDAETTKYNK